MLLVIMLVFSLGGLNVELHYIRPYEHICLVRVVKTNLASLKGEICFL